MTKEKKAVTVSLPLDLYEELKNLAEQSGRTLPRYICQILRKFAAYRGDIVEPVDFFRQISTQCDTPPCTATTAQKEGDI